MKFQKSYVITRATLALLSFLSLAVFANAQEIKVTRDIAYREGPSKAWRLDMAMPTEKSDGLRPAHVIGHGGGWRGGSRTVDVFQKMMADYAKKGYVTVNIDYRLTGEAPFPACIEDVKCAVRWLRAHAEKYQVDPKRIGAYGHSAGAHLALMLAMTTKKDGLEGDGGWVEQSSQVNVAVGGSPPTELGRETPMSKKEWWPIGYISDGHPPLFLVQGGADRIVRAELTEDFVAKMKKEGADLEYLKIENGSHDVAYASALDVTDPAIEKFLAKHLKPVAPQASVKKKSSLVVIEDGGTGPYSAVATEAWTLPGMTLFRPRDLSAFGDEKKLPVLLWGNGACANTTWEHKNFLSEIASHGYLIVAIGLLDEINERGEGSRQKTKSSQLLTGLDVILAENKSAESIYFGKLDASKVASMGMSCGGLQAIEISADPRISTTVVCNSGVLPTPSSLPGMPALSKEILKKFHAPVLYLMGCQGKCFRPARLAKIRRGWNQMGPRSAEVHCHHDRLRIRCGDYLFPRSQDPKQTKRDFRFTQKVHQQTGASHCPVHRISGGTLDAWSQSGSPYGSHRRQRVYNRLCPAGHPR